VSLSQASVQKRTVTTFSTIVLLLAGLASFFALGQLEDPEFTVKTAVVTTPYPGATAEEVELEVTDRVELAIQEMQQLKEIESFSRAGFSLITVDIQARYRSNELPQIWDELRKKVRDIVPQLPPGAGPPAVSDDFGDVFGFLLAVVSDGFTDADLERAVDEIKKELSLVPGVARVDRWGVQPSAIYVEATQARLSQLGLTIADIQRTLSQQNVVVDGGSIDFQGQRFRVQTTGEFSSPEEIGELVIRGASLNPMVDSAELMRIRDVAIVRRGYVQPPGEIMRFDGQPAIGLAISNLPGVNIVDLGAAIDARLAEIEELLPIGIEAKRISWQSHLVAESINGFVISLIQAVVIVLFVLWIAMGMRTAMIVGLCGLVFTIIASFVFMNVFGIDLQRMSLGALVIAMGMMVDNAIVVVDGIVVRMERGMDRVKAAVEAATLPSMPLLGATIVAVMAFYPIAASEESAGEYCATLFSVVAIALMLSWVLSVTITPVLCVALLPQPKADQADPYAGRLYVAFRGLLRACIKVRWLVVLVLIGMLVASGIGFGWVNQMFFPASARPQFMVDYWAPEGTRIQAVKANMGPIEEFLNEDEDVTAVSTFIGRGPPRFYLPVDPEILRDLAAQAEEIIAASPHAEVVRTSWRQRVKKIVAHFDQANARWTGVSRPDIASATRRAYDGLPVGQYREKDKLLPILLRVTEEERETFAHNLDVLQVRPPLGDESIPLAQLTTSIDVEWEDPLIWRFNRRRAITVQAVPIGLASVLRGDVIEAIEAIPLPDGYELMWDGEYRSARDAQQSLIPGMLPAAVIIAVIVVALFNAYRPPLIILCAIPFALIGVTVGLLATGQPFGFVALLGAMSLAGMMIKNAVVLLDQVNIEKEGGMDDFDAIMEAAMSRLRPVVLAAATTVLGVIPLLPDVFWVSMAVTIMFGLAFGTVITMIFVPVLYTILFRVKSR
jgi:multidrug efflux pump subunit AcrB